MNKLLCITWIFSPFGLYSIGRKQQAPADESNRINKIILFWFVFTRYDEVNKLIPMGRFKMVWAATTNEALFVPVMPWLKFDMWERLQK